VEVPQAAHAFDEIDGGVTAPAGFTAAGVAAGIKKSGKRDVALLAADHAVPAAAVYTTNTVAAAPVVLSRRHTAHGHIRAAVTNSGNANACTGQRGLEDARSTADAVAEALECMPDEVVVASTGVIGVPLPLDKVLAGVADAAGSLSEEGGPDAAEAILTTDTFVKQCAVVFTLDGRDYHVGGMAKGSGMIQPNMATMLAFVTTDAPLTPAACDTALPPATARRFNRLPVAPDPAPNDMCLLLASGAAGGEAIGVQDPRYATVAAAVHHVCGMLARMIVRDGEGATKFVEVTVRGAASEADAEKAAFAIADSPLCKTAIFGGDANWGRVAMAIGKSGAHVDPDAFDVVFAGVPTCAAGAGLPFDEAAAAAALSKRDVDILVDLHVGPGEATVWTGDLSYEYGRINGEYRS